MPRKTRFFLPNIPNHVVQRGRSRDPVFFESTDYLFYLEKLREALLKYDVSLHSYALMTNHIHLLMTAKDTTGISQVMQYVGRLYVPYVNKKSKRGQSQLMCITCLFYQFLLNCFHA